jgi:hypothetical protein
VFTCFGLFTDPKGKSVYQDADDPLQALSNKAVKEVKIPSLTKVVAPVHELSNRIIPDIQGFWRVLKGIGEVEEELVA